MVAMDRRKAYVLMVLWAVAHLSSPGSGLRALRRTTGGRRGSTGLTRQDANGVPLRRSKRGWMWNQFFLLEEYTGTDMQYVGKVDPELTFCFFSFSRHTQNHKSTAGMNTHIQIHTATHTCHTQVRGDINTINI